jgi:hypothetical protein
MKLKSFGCSLIFGSELADDGRDLPVPTASKYTWPAHLSRHLGYEYECYARPGAGNLQIAERVLSHSATNDPGLFIIGWTYIDRFDYTNSVISNHPIASKWQNWRTITPTDSDDLAKTYYTGLHTEYRDKLTTLMAMKLVIDTLTQKNIPFLMTYMDDLTFDDQWNTTPAITDLQNFVKPYLTTFENKNFLEWSRHYGYPEGNSNHPLEQAHQAAGDYIINIFDKQSTIDC